jgi:hypothetical protein
MSSMGSWGIGERTRQLGVEQVELDDGLGQRSIVELVASVHGLGLWRARQRYRTMGNLLKKIQISS